MYNKIPREGSIISLFNSYLYLNIDMVHFATNNRYADDNDIRLVNIEAIALFINYMLTSSSRKHLNDISHAHIVSSMYKLITSAKDTDDLPLPFDRDRERRRRELTHSKNQECKYHIRNMLRDVFGFAEHQEKAPSGLGYKLTLTRFSDNSVSNKKRQPTLVKLKLLDLNGLYHNLHPRFPKELYYLNSF